MPFSVRIPCLAVRILIAGRRASVPTTGCTKRPTAGFVWLLSGSEQRRQLLLVTGIDPAGCADAQIEALLEERFQSAGSSTWFDRLDAAGVPCELARDRAHDWYDDPDAVDNGWVVAYDHPVWGRLEQPGTFVHLSDTPGRIRGAPPVIGADTREVLEQIGYSDAEIDGLRAAGVVAW